MTRRLILTIVLAVGGCAGAQTRPAIDELALTVSTNPRQTFEGFGTSLTNFDGRFQEMKPEVRERLAKETFGDLNLKILRLWFSPAEFEQSGGLEPFKGRYIDSGLIDLARKHGVTTLLLAPNEVPQAFAAPMAKPDSFAYFTDDGVTAYAKLLADFIAKLKAAGVTIHATGVLNEPNDRPIRPSTAQWPAMIKSLRTELDRRGLKDVTIVAPEAASADRWAHQTIDALRNDPAAWEALGGIATHTYNMGATPAMARRRGDKPYWQTESSTPGPEPVDATERVNAATTSARVLGDLNHGVTHWIWFIGFEQSDEKDNGTRLIRYDATKPDGAVHRSAKYDVMKQLSAAFSVGAEVYPVQHPTEADMAFTYGRKPAVLATAARNADGSWAVGVVNFTSDRFASLPQEPRNQAGPEPGREINLTVHLPKLAGVDAATFAVHRSSRNTTESVVIRNGRFCLRLAPLELVTLRQTR